MLGFLSIILSLLISLVGLVALETVLGVDNVVFIGILSERLPLAERPRARVFGIAGALLTRIGLLWTISFFAGMMNPLFSFLGHAFSVKDLILLAGGLFLLYKATTEIHGMIEGQDAKVGAVKKVSFWGTVGMIMLMDIIFSLDSVITAVAMVNNIWIMVTAVAIAMTIMIFMINKVSNFIDEHPTVKTLALSFLLMIGFSLIAGVWVEIPKGFIYFAMGFSILVEFINTKVRARHLQQ